MVTSNTQVPCQCGCGDTVRYRDKWGKKRRFKKGHATRGPNHHLWKGKDCSYIALHRRIRIRLPKPEKCPECNLNEPYDVACLNGVYDMNLDNWRWMCRGCHLKYDYSHGFKKPRPRTTINRRCCKCGSNNTYNNGHSFPNWYVVGDQFQCKPCYQRERRRILLCM